MKKKEVKSEVKAEEKEVKEKKVRAVPKEMKQLNIMMRSVRKVGYKFIKQIAESNNAEQYIARLDEAVKELTTKIVNLSNEASLAVKFETMSEAEKEYIKKMLNN